ncbi:sulfatase-like hydrolase/transferase [Pontiella sp.]|uniref:sulfatase-like hydrolase/transferase n=1 Tax=Pontiella sp. TaxID=2837462 RepID=UPI0035617D4E
MKKTTTAAALGCLLSLSALAETTAVNSPAPTTPNVLFIAMDDLNNWIGCMGGHPQTITPNLDRLAKSGVMFSNAHCAAPACNPSRSAIMTGLSPHHSGLYENGQKMREVMPDNTLLSQYFRDHGYWASGSGKILHYFIDAHSWDEYYPKKEDENPFPRTLYPETRPLSLPRGGPWQYVETDWGPLDATEEEYGGDWLVTKYIGEQLGKEHDKPFFLACGIYRPHEPWFVPAKYFEPFPLEEIQLPPGYLENDLDDLPPAGQRMGPNRYFAHIQEQGQWKQGIQGYLASIHFADAMLGRVLDALENGPNKNNTIVVLWSDHGWHLGEKEHWQKYTAWRATTHIPLMVRVPDGISPALPQGTTAGSVCDQPVSLISLYPTLVELAGLPAKADNSGPSLLPLLKDAEADWDHVAITYLSRPGSIGISGTDWRYIHYANGDEELYNVENDPYEWKNLATLPEYAEKLAKFRTRVPAEFAPLVKAKITSLYKIPWVAASEKPVPASKPDGGRFNVHFINRRENPVQLFWMDQEGKPVARGTIEAGKVLAQLTSPGETWQIAAHNGTPLGHFVVRDRESQAVIPAD